MRKQTIHEQMAESAERTRREDRAMVAGSLLYVLLGLIGALFYSPGLETWIVYGFIGVLELFFLWRSNRGRHRVRRSALPDPEESLQN